MNKFQKQKRNQKRNSKRQTRSAVYDGNARRLPKASAPTSRLVFNPTWNPQAFKVARTFQYSAPPADVGAGFGKVYDPQFTPSATLLAYNSAAYSFAISDVYNVSELGALFDQYRIASVKLRFEFITSSESVMNPATATSQQMTLLIYEDYDDSTAPTASNAGWQAALEGGRAVRHVFPNKQNAFEYVLRPKYLIADVDTSATTTGRSLGAGWVDGSTGLDVVWRGLKMIGQTNPTTATAAAYNFRITATYYTEWRNRQ